MQLKLLQKSNSKHSISKWRFDLIWQNWPFATKGVVNDPLFQIRNEHTISVTFTAILGMCNLKVSVLTYKTYFIRSISSNFSQTFKKITKKITWRQECKSIQLTRLHFLFWLLIVNVMTSFVINQRYNLQIVMIQKNSHVFVAWKFKTLENDQKVCFKN